MCLTHNSVALICTWGTCQRFASIKSKAKPLNFSSQFTVNRYMISAFPSVSLHLFPHFPHPPRSTSMPNHCLPWWMTCVIGPGSRINHQTEISVSRTFSGQESSDMRKKCHVKSATILRRIMAGKTLIYSKGFRNSPNYYINHFSKKY